MIKFILKQEFKLFSQLENFRSREASVIQVHPQHPRTSNSNENNNAGHAGNNDDNNNNYFDSYFVNGIQYDNRFIGNLRPPFSGEKRLTKDEVRSFIILTYLYLKLAT